MTCTVHVAFVEVPELSGHAIDLHESQIQLMSYLPRLRLAHRILALEVLLHFNGFSHRLLERQRLAHALNKTRHMCKYAYVHVHVPYVYSSEYM